MTNKIAEELVGGMRQSVRPGVLKLRNFVQGRPAARKLMAEVKSIESLVASGSHPLHAAYSSAQTYLSVFSELASTLREFKDFTAVVHDAEATYMPSWPPISPVSVSFFTSWAFLDLPVAATGETICSCAVEIGRTFGMSADFASTLEAMGRSATGIYQHLGWRDGLVCQSASKIDRVSASKIDPGGGWAEACRCARSGASARLGSSVSAEPLRWIDGLEFGEVEITDGP